MDPANGQAQPAAVTQPCCCQAEHLTDREIDVISYVAEGLPNAEVAERMHISEHTVAGYVQAARQRLGARSRVDMVSRAWVLGLLELVWPPRPSGRRCIQKSY